MTPRRTLQLCFAHSPQLKGALELCCVHIAQLMTSTAI